MKKVYVIVKKGKVVNRVVAESPMDDSWIQSKKAKIGDSYDGSKFKAAPKKARQEPQINWDSIPRDIQVKIIDDLEARGVITTSQANKIKGK